MTDRRPTAGPAAHPFARRLRALLEPTTSPLPRNALPRFEPARRSRLGAAWQARAAVRAGMPLEDFLRARLARYLADLPVPSARLPIAIAIDDGRIACRATAPDRATSPAAEAGADGWTGPLASSDGPAVRQEAAELEVRVAVLDGEIDGARRRAEEIAHRFAGDVAAGLVAAPPGVDATAEQMGRPPVRSGAPRAALLAVAASALGAEAWQIAVPLLAGAGVDPGAIAREAAARPGDVASLVLFALGVTAALFALSQAALAAGAALLAAEADPRRRWLGAAGLASGALAALVAISVAALPRPGAAPAGAALALLLLAVPVGAALVARAAARLEAARGEEAARALAWDRDRALALAERDRRLEELRWAEDEVVELDRQREAARRRLRELNARAIAVARLAAQAAEQERAGLARLAQGLVAALELDRYAYVRLAAARGVPEPAPRRRVAEPRGGVFDAPPDGGSSEVEAGRLAS